MSAQRHVVLVCEDCDEDFETLCDAVAKAGIRADLIRARSGDECLMLLRDKRNSHAARPTLVLMDLNTSGTDGREALREIKEDERLKCIPVLVFSTSANPVDLAFCYCNGANAYHIKPVDYSQHMQILTEVLNYWLGIVSLVSHDRGATP